MVIAESYSTSKRARTLNSNIASGSGGHDSSDPMDSTDQVVRVGNDYQAEIPDSCLSKPAPEDYPEKSEMVWTPENDLKEKELRDYLKVAAEKYMYNDEQSLAMLYFHKFDLSCALADLANFAPYPEEWTSEEKIIFEQGYQFHSKNFKKISQLLPEKKLSSVIKFYYNWKKIKAKSYVERQMRRSQKDDVSANNNIDIDSDAEFDPSSSFSEQLSLNNVFQCTNCKQQFTTFSYITKQGNLCTKCYPLLKKNKNNTPQDNNQTEGELPDLASKSKQKAQMLEEIVKERELNIDVLSSLDAEIKGMKQNLRELKQQNAAKKASIEGFELPTLNQSYNNRIIARWTPEELALITYAIADHRKDFKTVAEIMGTKSELQISNYYLQHGDKIGLNRLAEEFPSGKDDAEDSSNSSSNAKAAKFK